MAEVARRILADPVSHAIVWGGALAYLAAFLIAIGDLAVDGIARPVSMEVAGNWEALVLRSRTPFHFEAVAVADAPYLVWLISPVNMAIGAILGLLTGLQLALVRIARRCAKACGAGPAAGLLAGLPGLLAGSACCAPILLLLLGIQVTASLVTLMGLLIPAAFILLLAGLVLTIRFTDRRCREASA